jgi:5-methylcytosine-specific restriction endonuclease McrA
MATNPRYANGHRRRKLRAQILAEEDVCGVCGQLVDKDLPPGLPDSAEIDEIQPISRGGSPLDRENCRLSHRRCNVGRNRTRPTIQPYRSPRTW